MGRRRTIGRLGVCLRLAGAFAEIGAAIDRLRYAPPRRPQLPVIAAMYISARLVWTAFVYWLMPRLANNTQPSAAAISAASRRISCAAIPVSGSAHSGV